MEFAWQIFRMTNLFFKLISNLLTIRFGKIIFKPIEAFAYVDKIAQINLNRFHFFSILKPWIFLDFTRYPWGHHLCLYQSTMLMAIYPYLGLLNLIDTGFKVLLEFLEINKVFVTIVISPELNLVNLYGHTSNVFNEDCIHVYICYI